MHINSYNSIIYALLCLYAGMYYWLGHSTPPVRLPFSFLHSRREALTLLAITADTTKTETEAVIIESRSDLKPEEGFMYSLGYKGHNYPNPNPNP